jgi:hypothetical protein
VGGVEKGVTVIKGIKTDKSDRDCGRFSVFLITIYQFLSF